MIVKLRKLRNYAVKMKNFEDKLSPEDKWFFMGIKNMYWSEND